jgi:hypothetical protein
MQQPFTSLTLLHLKPDVPVVDVLDADVGSALGNW